MRPQHKGACDGSETTVIISTMNAAMRRLRSTRSRLDDYIEDELVKLATAQQAIERFR
jgi:hypothetical protein